MADPRDTLKAALNDLALYAKDAKVMARRKPTPEILDTLRARLTGAQGALCDAYAALDAVRDTLADD